MTKITAPLIITIRVQGKRGEFCDETCPLTDNSLCPRRNEGALASTWINGVWTRYRGELCEAAFQIENKVSEVKL